MLKWHYYVGVSDNNVAKLLTGLDPKSKTVVWAEDGIPMDFKKVEADKMASLLSENGYTSFVLKSPFVFKTQFGGE